MSEADPKELVRDMFKLMEGAEVFIVYCLDDDEHYSNTRLSSGRPLKTIELHSYDDKQAVATVFSCNTGRRMLVIFNLEDVRAV